MCFVHFKRVTWPQVVSADFLLQGTPFLKLVHIRCVVEMEDSIVVSTAWGCLAMSLSSGCCLLSMVSDWLSSVLPLCLSPQVDFDR